MTIEGEKAGNRLQVQGGEAGQAPYSVSPRPYSFPFLLPPNSGVLRGEQRESEPDFGYPQPCRTEPETTHVIRTPLAALLPASATPPPQPAARFESARSFQLRHGLCRAAIRQRASRAAARGGDWCGTRRRGRAGDRRGRVDSAPSAQRR